MANGVGENNLATKCEALQEEICSCYSSKNWQSENPIKCKEHKSAEHFFDVENTHVIIVCGGGESAEVFKDSCEKLQEALKDKRFLGLSDGNVTVIEATTERKVPLRMLSLKLQLEDKVIEQAFSRLRSDLKLPDKSGSDLRQKIFEFGNNIWKSDAEARCKRKCSYSCIEKLVFGFYKKGSDVFAKIFSLAWRRLTELKINLTQRPLGPEHVTKQAEDVLTSFHLWGKNILDASLISLRDKERKQLQELCEKQEFEERLSTCLTFFFDYTCTQPDDSKKQQHFKDILKKCRTSFNNIEHYNQLRQCLKSPLFNQILQKCLTSTMRTEDNMKHLDRCFKEPLLDKILRQCCSSFSKTEKDQLYKCFKRSEPLYSIDDLGCKIDEFFQVVISTSFLYVSPKALTNFSLEPLKPDLLKSVKNKPQVLIEKINELLRPLPKGILWYYYCGDATGLGDDELDDKALPKALLEATGRLLANLVVTLDCSHAEANLPNILHFVDNGLVSLSYTAFTSCTARQKANYNGQQPFTSFLTCALRSADKDCRFIFKSCFGIEDVDKCQCQACKIYRESEDKHCEYCVEFRSSTREFRALADIFAYVKAHLCSKFMNPVMQRSRKELILPIAYVHKEASAGKVEERETAHSQPTTTGSEIESAINYPDGARVGYLASADSKRRSGRFQETITSKEKENEVHLDSTNAHVIIVSGPQSDINDNEDRHSKRKKASMDSVTTASVLQSHAFIDGCRELKKALTDHNFVGVREDNILVIEPSSDKEVKVRLLSLMLRLEKKLIDKSCSDVLKLSGLSFDHEETVRQKIVHVCTHVRKRLALQSISKKKKSLRTRKSAFEADSTLAKLPLESLLDIACTRAENLRMLWLSQENENAADQQGDVDSRKKTEEDMLALFHPWEDGYKSRNIIEFREREFAKLQELVGAVDDWEDVKVEIDTCFRELIMTPFLPVSIEAITMGDFESNGTMPLLQDIKPQIRDFIVDCLRPLEDELIWYYYCGHARSHPDSVLDERLLPKRLLEATGRLAANMIVTLDCCYAEANIPDIRHFMGDRLRSSFTVMASCAASQQSFYGCLPAFTQYFVHGLKNASVECKDVDNDLFTVNSCRDSKCGACKIVRKETHPCKECRHFSSSTKPFHTLDDIFHLVQAHICPKRMLPVIKQSNVERILFVARANVKTSICEKPRPPQDGNMPSEIMKEEEIDIKDEHQLNELVGKTNWQLDTTSITSDVERRTKIFTPKGAQMGLLYHLSDLDHLEAVRENARHIMYSPVEQNRLQQWPPETPTYEPAGATGAIETRKIMKQQHEVAGADIRRKLNELVGMVAQLLDVEKVDSDGEWETIRFTLNGAQMELQYRLDDLDHLEAVTEKARRIIYSLVEQNRLQQRPPETPTYEPAGATGAIETRKIMKQEHEVARADLRRKFSDLVGIIVHLLLTEKLD